MGEINLYFLHFFKKLLEWPDAKFQFQNMTDVSETFWRVTSVWFMGFQ